VSFTTQPELHKVVVSDVRLALGFEMGGLRLKFDDYSLCFGGSGSGEKGVENVLD
jgi:hypothetical protein